MVKKLIYIFLGCLIVLTIGCATQAPKTEQVSLSDLKNKKVAFNFHSVDKTIVYQETLFRVLWVTHKDDSVSYDGLWDIDSDLVPIYTTGFENIGIKADYINNDMLNAHKQELAAAYISAPKEGAKEVEKKIIGPSLDFYKTVPEMQSFQPLREELRKDGYSYLVEVYVTSLRGNAPGYGMVIVGCSKVINIIDLDNNTVVWNGRTGTHDVHQLGGDLTALEKDDLRILKDSIMLKTEELFSKGMMSRLFGFSE